MTNPDELRTRHVAGLMSAVLKTTTDVASLKMTDVQLSSFLHAVSWHMGGSKDDVDGFVVVLSQEEGTLTTYWVKANAIGSLTATKPAAGDSGPLPISGWMRSLRKVQKIDLSVDVRVDQFSAEKDVRPGVRIHFRDLEQPIELSAAELPNQEARDAVARFITHVRTMIEGAHEGTDEGAKEGADD